MNGECWKGLFGHVRSEGPSDLRDQLKALPALFFGRVGVGILEFSSPKVSTEAGPPPGCPCNKRVVRYGTIAGVVIQL